jgi:hypothetical protein
MLQPRVELLENNSLKIVRVFAHISIYFKLFHRPSKAETKKVEGKMLG